MATYRYQIIRRDIYEECSKQTPDRFRTLADMRKLFKARYWALITGIVICLIAGITFLSCFPSSIYSYIPFVIVLPLSIIHEFWGYRMCHPSELQKEHDEVMVCFPTTGSIVHAAGIPVKDLATSPGTMSTIAPSAFTSSARALPGCTNGHIRKSHS